MNKLKLLGPAPLKAIAPTPTTMVTVRVLTASRLSIEVANLDGSQTLDVLIYRRMSEAGQFSLTPVMDLVGIPAGETRSVDLDCAGSLEIQLRGTASGGGLNASWAGILVEVL